MAAVGGRRAVGQVSQPRAPISSSARLPVSRTNFWLGLWCDLTHLTARLVVSLPAASAVLAVPAALPATVLALQATCWACSRLER